MNGYGVVSLGLEELLGPVDSGIGSDVNPSPEVEPAVLLSRLLVGPLVSTDEFVRGSVVSVALIEMLVIVGIEVDEPVSGGAVENPVLNIELAGLVGPGAVIVEFGRGYGGDDSVPLITPLLVPTVPLGEEELAVILLLTLVTRLVGDSWELGMIEPDEGRLEVKPIPLDGDVVLPVSNVELVNGYGVAKLEPDGCKLLLLPVVKGGDVVLESPLNSDVTIVEEMPLEPMSVLEVSSVGMVVLLLLLVSENCEIVATDEFPNVRLPVAERLLSDMLLVGVGGAVVPNKEVEELDPSFADVPSEEELPVRLGTVSVVAALVIMLEGTNELCVELVLDNELGTG